MRCGAENKYKKNFKAPSRGGEPSQARLGLFAPPNVPTSASLSEVFQMDDNGSLWLNRKLRDHWIATDRPVLAVFIQILLRVQWKDNAKTVYFNGCEIKLKRGQMTCGRIQMGQWAGVSGQEYRTAIKKLESTHTITIKSTNKFSIISLVNWDKYQQINQQVNKKSTSHQHSINIPSTTLEEGKKIIKKEIKICDYQNCGKPIPKGKEIQHMTSHILAEKST